MFKEVDEKTMSDLDSVVLIMSVSISDEKPGDPLEITAFLFDLRDCKIFGSYSTKLLRVDDDKYYGLKGDNDYHTYEELLRYLYKDLWYSACQCPKIINVLVFNKNDSIGGAEFIRDLFKESHNVLGRSLSKAKIYDIFNNDPFADYVDFLKSKRLVVENYSSLFTFFGLDISINSLNQGLALAGFCYLSNIYDKLLETTLSEESILQNLENAKAGIIKEIKDVSKAVSYYSIMSAV